MSKIELLKLKELIMNDQTIDRDLKVSLLQFINTKLGQS